MSNYLINGQELNNINDQYLILNNIFPVYFNENNNRAIVQNTSNDYKLYFGKDISNFANECSKLNYNLSNLNIGIKYVENMANAFSGCKKIIGEPFCGNNVLNMKYAYYGCTSLTGNPSCGDCVLDLERAYVKCYNLNGYPVCGNNVINMSRTYYNCNNLIGSPVCGNSVVDMSKTYYECVNLNSNNFSIGRSIEDMTYAYFNCYNLYGDFYCNNIVYKTNELNMHNCFYGRNVSNRLNIHIDQYSKFENLLKNHYDKKSAWMYGIQLNWNNFNFIYNNNEYIGLCNEEYNTYIYIYDVAGIVGHGIVGKSIIIA